MKTFFKFLHANQVISSNPANAVEHPKYKISPPRLLTKMEYLALRDITRNNVRLYTIVELLLQTGIRIGELARLKLEDINLESKKKSIIIKPFGSSKGRKVPLTEQAVSAIKKYLSIRPQPKEKVNTLFVTKNGNPLLVRNIRTSISRALEKVGIEDATVNDIRNTFIVHQLKQGMSVEMVGDLVGHKRLTSTKRYLDLIDKKPKRKSTKIVPL
jgi:site-specific recombinase XerD